MAEFDLGYIKGPKGDRGEKGAQGERGVGIQSITFMSQDDNGGSVYKIVYTDGQESRFTVPKGESKEPSYLVTATKNINTDNRWDIDSFTIPLSYRVEFYDNTGALIGYSNLNVGDGLLNYKDSSGQWQSAVGISTSSSYGTTMSIAYNPDLISAEEVSNVYVRVYTPATDWTRFKASLPDGNSSMTPNLQNRIIVLDLMLRQGQPFAYAIADSGVTGNCYYNYLDSSSVGADSNLTSYYCTLSPNNHPDLTNSKPYWISRHYDTPENVEYTFMTIPLGCVPPNIINSTSDGATTVGALKFSLSGTTLNIDTF